MNIGYFDDLKQEYIIKDMFPRRKLINYLWNEETVCQLDHFGSGFTWTKIGFDRKHIESGERVLYIKDLDNNVTYSANRNFDKLPFDVFETHVGLGYHTVISEYLGIRVEFTTLVPSKGRVVEFRIRVINKSGKNRKLNLYFSICPTPSLTWHDAYSKGYYDDKFNSLVYSHNGIRMSSNYIYTFVSSLKKINYFDTTDESFIGVYNSYANPIGLQNEHLANSGSTFHGHFVAASEFDLSLDKDEEFTNLLLASTCQSEDDINKINEEYLSWDAFDNELIKQKEIHAKLNSSISVKTPDEIFNSQNNIWLKRQVSIGKTWGRLYGRGFRDVFQDIAGFTILDPKLSREKIIDSLKYQFEDGNCIRQFLPSYRYPYNDGPSWIATTLLTYINETGDLTILDEKVPYLKGTTWDDVVLVDSYKFEEYEFVDHNETVLNHLEKAFNYYINDKGIHGLVKWYGGDWNDSINSAGLNGKGESVWLTIAVIKAMKDFVTILSIAGLNEKTEKYLYEISNYKSAIEEHAIIDGHIIYGFTDTGKIVGGNDRIFMNPQTWAVFSELFDKETLNKLMDQVEGKLQCPYGYMLNFPAYYKGEEDVGRTTYFTPGLVENASVYNHGVCWKIRADCMLGRGDLAYKTLKMIRFDNPDNKNNGMEPYAVSNMFIGPMDPNAPGYAPMSWISGTAGTIFKTTIEDLIGIKPIFKGLVIKPCLPSMWNELEATRVFRGETYHIIYKRSVENKVVCDGNEVDVLPLSGIGTKHEVIVYFK